MYLYYDLEVEQQDQGLKEQNVSGGGGGGGGGRKVQSLMILIFCTNSSEYTYH